MISRLRQWTAYRAPASGHCGAADPPEGEDPALPLVVDRVLVKPWSKPYSSLSRSGLIGCPVKSCWRPFRTILPNSASGGQSGDLEELAEGLAKGLAEELAKELAFDVGSAVLAAPRDPISEC